MSNTSEKAALPAVTTATTAPVPAPGAKTRRRRRGFDPRMLTYQILLGCALIGAWQIGSQTGVLDPFFFSDPVNVFSQIVQWFASGFIWEHLAATAWATILAFVIGTVAGLLVGVLFGRVQFLERLFDPFVKMFNALPRLILAPIFLLWFGLDIGSKVALGVTLVFFVVFFNTLEGIKSVSSVLIDNSRMLGASESQLLRTVYIPSALGWIFSSLHSSIGFAIIGAVIGEYLGAYRGIGYVIAQAQGTFDTTSVFAGMIVLMVFVLVIEFFITKAERHLLRWRQVSTK